MADRYTVHNVLLESADFHVLIIEFPEDEVNDKLALLSSEKGLIYQHFYENFVIGTCMANAGPFFYHVRRRPELVVKFADIRKEALALVYEKSPGFKPENIIINQNNVLKTKTSARPGEQARPLVENDLWHQDPPLNTLGPINITSPPTHEKPDNPFRNDEDSSEGIPDNPFAGLAGSGEIDVPYELIGHKWESTGLYLNVRKYEESDEALISLLGGTPFETDRGYHLLIVERCIEDFADVFQLLDSMGVSKKNKPATLIKELYEIAIEHNPFLKLENVDLKSVRQDFKNRHANKTRSNRRIAHAAGEDRVVSSRKRSRFSDLPKEKLLHLADEIKKGIVGQDEAVNHISDAVQRASVGLKREHEPMGVFLFTGNTGVGKTETAKVLASALDAHLVRIDCQDYQQPHEAAKLTGSPPGYVGYDDGGHLTKEVAKYPFSVVLFDEIEKGHSNFHERILQLIDEGVLTDNKGKKISFQETIIVMTSNIGVKEVQDIGKTVGFGDVSQHSDTKAGKARAEALKRKFKPEFLNRVDDVVHFRRLENKDYMHILDILLKEVREQIYKSRGIVLSFNVGAKNFLLDKGIDKKFGARPLRRTVKKHLNTPLARAILAEEIEDGAKVSVSLKPEKDGLIFRTASKRRTADG